MSQDETTTRAPTADEPTTPPSDGVKPMIRKAVEKHLREWEGLMDRYAYRWAAYHGDVRLEIGKSKHKLYRKYLDRGLSLDQLVVLGIGPPMEDDPLDESPHESSGEPSTLLDIEVNSMVRKAVEKHRRE